MDLAPVEVPLALADLHGTSAPGERVELILGDADGDEVWRRDVVEGAGFTVDSMTATALFATRARSLPDTVGPGMRLLVSGLNPSEHAADAGIGFVTPGNRFWPAALAAGLVSLDRNPRHALSAHGIGMTDLVKRATPRADVLTAAEYRAGLERLDRLCAWLQPGAMCFVGLAGWRSAVDRKATAGPQERRLGGRPVYVMPSTSGLNASSKPADFVTHLLAATSLCSLPRT